MCVYVCAYPFICASILITKSREQRQTFLSFRLASFFFHLLPDQPSIHPHICLRLFLQVHAHSVLSCGRCFDEDQVLFPFLSHALSCLLADQGVRAAAARGYEYELNDSAL